MSENETAERVNPLAARVDEKLCALSNRYTALPDVTRERISLAVSRALREAATATYRETRYGFGYYGPEPMEAALQAMTENSDG